MLWEYRIDTVAAGGLFVTGDVDQKATSERLNAFGGQGWELVSSYPTTYANGGSHLLVFIYKRPKTDPVIPPVAPAKP